MVRESLNKMRDEDLKESAYLMVTMTFGSLPAAADEIYYEPNEQRVIMVQRDLSEMECKED